MGSNPTTEQKINAVGLSIVVALHAALLWGLWSHGLIPVPEETMTIFVNFISPPSSQKVAEPAKPSVTKLHPAEKPEQLVAETPIVAPTDSVAPQPVHPNQPIEGSAGFAQMALGPVTLGSELSIVCNERTPPIYPPVSRRFNEEGTVILRVELDEQGRVATAHIVTGSGYTRLDEAALAAIHTWRCAPTRRNGQAVRATALQPFKFILQGN